MRLTDVVAHHGFAPCNLATIENARLYQREHDDGVLELLCVQKIGSEMRVDRQPLVAISTEDLHQPPLLLPIGTGINNRVVPRDSLEDYLNSTLAA